MSALKLDGSFIGPVFPLRENENLEKESWLTSPN